MSDIYFFFDPQLQHLEAVEPVHDPPIREAAGG